MLHYQLIINDNISPANPGLSAFGSKDCEDRCKPRHKVGGPGRKQLHGSVKVILYTRTHTLAEPTPRALRLGRINGTESPKSDGDSFMVAEPVLRFLHSLASSRIKQILTSDT